MSGAGRRRTGTAQRNNCRHREQRSPCRWVPGVHDADSIQFAPRRESREKVPGRMWGCLMLGFRTGYSIFVPPQRNFVTPALRR
jgi:hypothetical protein